MKKRMRRVLRTMTAPTLSSLQRKVPIWARAQMSTLRCKLLKVGAVIVRNTRRIRFFISSAFPYRDIFVLVARRFASG